MKHIEKLLLSMLLGIAIIGLLFVTYGYDKTYGLWNVPTMYPHFADLRVITTASETYAQGIDPLIRNPTDQLQRPMNYPRVWQNLFKFGIDQTHTTGVGIVLIMLFFIGNYLFLQKTGTKSLVFVMPMLFSPAVLLGIERANIDLLMFFLLSAVIVLANKSYVSSLCLVFTAFTLKLYPIFGLAVLLRIEKTTLLKVAFGSILVVGLYSIIMHDELLLISNATPRSTVLSYGINVLWMRIINYDQLAGVIVKVLSYTVAVLVLCKGLSDFVLDSNPNWLSTASDSDYDSDSFRVGCAVYVGTFMIGNNWDYRLMFLLFVIPQLVKWSYHEDKKVSRISVLTLCCVFVSMWYLTIEHTFNNVPHGATLSYAIKEMSNWFVFCGLLYLLVCSLPEWARTYVRRLTLERRIIS